MTTPAILRCLPFLAPTLLASFAAAQGPLSIGNLVVLRIGDNVATNSNAATPVFLDEYTATGTFVQTIPMPTVASGSNRAFTNSGSATSEGLLGLSTNGLYLTLVGYDAPVGTASIAGTAVATTNRVVGRVDLLGMVDTSTALTDAFDATNPRAAVTDDGNRFWVTGGAPAAVGPTHGVRFVANLGDTTSVAVNAGSPNNCRGVGIYHGDLYITSASGTTHGVARVGTGLPTAPASASIALLPGFRASSGPSSYDMFWASPTTVYVADDGTGGGGGIKKWELSGGTWTNTYTLAPGALTGCMGITGQVINGTTTLWVTTRVGAGSTTIATVVDSGPGSVVTTIVTAPALARFRGIRRIGLPPITAEFPIACGAAGIKVTGNAEIGTNVYTSVTNSAFGLGLICYGLFPLFVPFCNCTVAHELTVIVGANDHTMQIVPSWATIGLNVYVQAIDLFGSGGCPDPFLTLTECRSFTIQ